MIGIAIFLGFAILSIPGWIVCISCCCCCCTKLKYKIPFFVVTTVLYLLVVVVFIIGLAKSNAVFRGLSDTECSILQFCNEVIDSETTDQKPKWIGIQGINGLLGDVVGKINSLGETTLNNLRDQNNAIVNEKDEFETLLQTNSEKLVIDNSENPQIYWKWFIKFF